MTSAWMMSIRTRIFLGCISLTLVTVLVGFLSQGTQTKLSQTALGIYDDAFQSMNYLRSAQSIILGISRDIAAGEKNNAIFVDQIGSALDALEVARERAMSPKGEELAGRLRTSLLRLQDSLRNAAEPATRSAFQPIEHTFDLAVGVYASDGFRLRRAAEDMVRDTRLATYAAMLGSVVIALIITLTLSGAIVPSIRKAVTVASAIASGKLDNAIDAQGSGETGTLLKALATMQASIREKIGFIEQLMAQQASSHDVAIAAQNARFETALDHMTLGLRMFDANDALVVQNRRFSEMFETEEAVDDLMEQAAVRPPGGSDPGSEAESATYTCLLKDGRTIEVSEEAMAGGGRVVTYEDITERQRAAADLSHMVRHDALTGLPNRVMFREHLQAETPEKHPDSVLSVLCLDLDRFKSVNDTLGHPVGDELLREAATRLVGIVGEGGIVVRLGGDEFAIIHRGRTRGEDARTLAERVIDVLNRPFDIDGHHITIGVSVGIVESVDGSETPSELLKSADLALYAAKAAGRGIYRFFEPEMSARVQARRRMELGLRSAIANEQFAVHYQPIVNAKTGAVVAFEALIRWYHPERGLVPPAEFIPLAEEAGLIPEIGLWILKRACRDATAWPTGIRVAINLSPLQFQYRNLVGDVEGALRQSGLCATRLDLEITESLLLQNSEVTLSILHDLKALGISISMDDFGTGYSSLSYLRRFPFDKIKIDRSFISDIGETSESLAIVKAIIRLGEALKMNIVAEGVETIEQKSLLCRVGCQELQGYLFSRPQPADSIEAVLQRISFDHAA
ncbi:putative bifunctional diguanylate cyclase/phosphodiesterase [Methylobacterium iners]|uniref:Diguanylate cyclase n=1 Tax=Methylobacterium iners TaxID=418707 RepID=A0ABQ4RZ57_9HYPH|nr:EAL domain-containing protein [Methylobacterium iners]GJD95494.1 hypothetical protein OCOJLMKI_2707 [Methylobacterium iners]